jgi:hypothetical protein
MLVYKKENGFPMDLILETGDHQDIVDGVEWKGYETMVSDVDLNLIASFKHKNFRDRVIWVNGFFSGLKYLKPWLSPLFLDEEDEWKDPSLPLINEKEISNLEVGDWIVTKDGKVRRIEMDSQEDLQFEKIERFASRNEAKNAKEINELIQELKRVESSNKSSWDIYGSELCAGSMIAEEKTIENKINKLREDVS